MKRITTHILIFICGLIATTSADDGDWQPLLHADSYYEPKTFGGGGGGGFGLLGGGYHPEETVPEPANDQCALYKVGFNQDLYFQYIQYKTQIPDLKEFTLCYWAKFNNHSNDHPIFSYAVDGQPKAIYSWITNTERSSYFSMNIEGHTFYRLNYPLRLKRWYHACQSWNGKTGEWQIWVNAERVGRGFHNRLVGHVVPAGGIAVTGQSQSQLGGGFQEGTEAPKGSGGMLGEVTMLQLYSVALTAGKAHKDHKHHHAHQYDHNGNMITTPAPTTTVRSPLPTHPLLTGGQLNRNIRINFGAGQQPQVIQGQEFNVGYANGQLVGGLVTQQLTRGAQQSQIAQLAQLTQQGVPYLAQQQLLPQGAGSFGTQFGVQNGNSLGAQYGVQNGNSLGSQFGVQSSNSLANPVNVQYIDTPFGSRSLFKRHNKEEASVEAAEDNAEEPQFGDKIVEKREADSDDKKQKKRELFVAGGTIFDDGFTNIGPTVSSPQLQQNLLYGLAGIGDNQPILRKQKENDEREPAEAEVMAVMNICSGCDEEPFDKALIFGWRTVPKKLFSGAYYGPAISQCRVF